jgi:hypothetical protein
MSGAGGGLGGGDMSGAGGPVVGLRGPEAGSEEVT